MSDCSSWIGQKFPAPWYSSWLGELWHRDLEVVAFFVVWSNPDHLLCFIHPNSSISRLRLQHCTTSARSIFFAKSLLKLLMTRLYSFNNIYSCGGCLFVCVHLLYMWEVYLSSINKKSPVSGQKLFWIGFVLMRFKNVIIGGQRHLINRILAWGATKQVWEKLKVLSEILFNLLADVEIMVIDTYHWNYQTSNSTLM